MPIINLDPSLLVKKGTKRTAATSGFFKYHNPKATLIIDGALELSGNGIYSHIHAKNIVITPTGSLSLKNTQLLVEENLMSCGKIEIENGSCYVKNTIIAETAPWLQLRHQLTSYNDNIKASDRIRTANSFFNQQLPSAAATAQHSTSDAYEAELSSIILSVD